MGTISAVSGDLEIYAAAILLGNTAPMRWFPKYPKNIRTYHSAVPTTGSWERGDTVYNTAPASGAFTEATCVATGSPGTWLRRFLPFTGSTTVDVVSIADGASLTSSGVTVTGATLGDRVEVTCSIDLQGLTLTGYVSAANTVRFLLSNQTGSAVDLASATYKFWVTPQLD